MTRMHSLRETGGKEMSKSAPLRIRLLLPLVLLLGSGILQAAPSLLLRATGMTSTITLALELDGFPMSAGIVLGPNEVKRLFFPVPVDMSTGTHDLKVTWSGSTSGSGLASFEVLFEPNILFLANGTPRVRDAVTPARRVGSYKIQVDPRPGFEWGVLVRADLPATLPQETIFDYLVGVYDGYLVFRSDISFADDGGIKVNERHAYDNNARIRVYDDGNKDLLSMFYAPDSTDQAVTRTYDLWRLDGSQTRSDGDVLYEGGLWRITQRSKDGDTVFYTSRVFPTSYLYALFHTKGKKYGYKEVKGMLSRAAGTAKIPRHILYGVAYEESDYTHRWQQFDPVSQWSVVTGDGGIGLMQLTQGTALAGATNDLALERLALLATSIQANIEAGADVLRNKWDELAKDHPVGGGDRWILEDWFYAVRIYNTGKIYRLGWIDSQGRGYAERVYGWIKANPRKWWDEAKVSLPNKEEEAKTHTIPYTPAPAHAEDAISTTVNTIEAKLDLSVAVNRSTGSARLDWKLTNPSSARIPLGGLTIAKASVATSSREEVVLPKSSLPAGGQLLKPLKPGETWSFSTDITLAPDEKVEMAWCEVNYYSNGDKDLYIKTPKAEVSPGFLSAAPEFARAPASPPPLSFSVVPSADVALPGQTVEFTGSVQNNSSLPQLVNGCTFDTYDTNAILDGADFLMSLPDSVPSGGAWQGHVFSLRLQDNAPDGYYQGSVTIVGGETPASRDEIASASFSVRVGPEQTGLAVVTISRQANGAILLHWSGGSAPYQVQTTESIVSETWQNYGGPTNDQSVELPTGSASAFFRIISAE